MSMDTSVETTGLGKHYGRTWALRDCSLNLPTGRVVGLVGPNGAGKTTLLHLAVGLLRPTAGGIRVLGERPADNPGLRARVGFVAQNTPLYPDFTATDLLALGRRLNRHFDEPAARNRLAGLGIPLDRRSGRLSGGQRAQVALALALAKQPELLLLDEPVANLDPLARRSFMQALMGAVAEHGTTVVLSSHLIADLEQTCDYLVVLHASRVQVLGAVDDLLGQHRVLVAPRTTKPPTAGIGQIVQTSHSDRQTTLLVRTNGPVTDPSWTTHEVSLEELVLAYLAAPDAGALPGPVGLFLGRSA
jgi:ABC-2 type transport system ATP-binding protein